jgi:hypothetical protein
MVETLVKDDLPIPAEDIFIKPIESGSHAIRPAPATRRVWQYPMHSDDLKRNTLRGLFRT